MNINHINSRSFVVSTLFASILAVSGTASAVTDQAVVNRGEVTPAAERSNPAANTLQQRVEDHRGELVATQPGRVEVNETVDERTVQRPNVASQPQSQPQTTSSSISDKPLLKGEVHTGNITPADERNTSAPITLQEKVKDNRGELVATQPGEVELQENRRVSPL